MKISMGTMAPVELIHIIEIRGADFEWADLRDGARALLPYCATSQMRQLLEVITR